MNLVLIGDGDDRLLWMKQCFLDRDGTAEGVEIIPPPLRVRGDGPRKGVHPWDWVEKGQDEVHPSSAH